MDLNIHCGEVVYNCNCFSEARKNQLTWPLYYVRTSWYNSRRLWSGTIFSALTQRGIAFFEMALFPIKCLLFFNLISPCLLTFVFHVVGQPVWWPLTRQNNLYGYMIHPIYPVRCKVFICVRLGLTFAWFCLGTWVPSHIWSVIILD